MNELTKGILIITVGIFTLIAAYFLLGREKKIKPKNTAELNNVKDIINGVVYTFDNKVMQYIRIFPISADLYSAREKEILTSNLTNRLSSIPKLSFRFLSVSRPVDISGLITEHQDLLYEAKNQVQRDLLKKEIAELARFALEGDVVERQFYFRLTGQEKKLPEMKKQILEICNIFRENKIDAKECDTYDVIKLGNMVSHPQYVHMEENNIDNLLPMLIKTN